MSGGIQEFQSPASIVGNVSISAPSVGDAHVPTLGDFGALLMGWNNVTWDRLQVDANKNLKVIPWANNVEVIKSLNSLVYDFGFWGSVVNTDIANVGLNVTLYNFRKIIIKNNTNATITQIRIYAFLRKSDLSEIHRATVDLADLAAGAIVSIDATNFAEIDGAWNYLLVRTNAAGSTTGSVEVHYISKGHL